MLAWKNYLIRKDSDFQALDYHWIKGIYKDEKQTLRISFAIELFALSDYI